MMLQLLFFTLLALLSNAEDSNPSLRRELRRKPIRNVCVIGCTPYVNLYNGNNGIEKFKALLKDMADDCDMIVHVGDTKTGGAPCNKDTMSAPLHMVINATKPKSKMVLYAIGDNEATDCHRAASRPVPIAAEYLKAADAREFFVNDLNMSNGRDLTGRFRVESHIKLGNIPGTSQPYSCDFDKLVVAKDFILITIEVPGSQWWLTDESKRGYPNQDTVDPLADRFAMYLNAKDCALEWITMAAQKANQLGKRAVIITLQAHFWEHDIYGAVKKHLDSALDGIGDYYNKTNLSKMTLDATGVNISEPYEPLYTHMKMTALNNSKIMFVTANADTHFWSNIRANSDVDNRPAIVSNHNWMIHQVDGSSRALTGYTKIVVNDNDFQPVQFRQEWSEAAFNASPIGHAYVA